MTQSKTHGKNT